MNIVIKFDTNLPRPISEPALEPDREQLYCEVLLVLDTPLLEFHQDTDVENYALMIFNMVNILQFSL